MSEVYTTIQGDMWDKIAKDVYGDEMKADVLMQANPDHMRTVIFSGGVEIACPEIEQETDITLPEWRR